MAKQPDWNKVFAALDEAARGQTARTGNQLTRAREFTQTHPEIRPIVSRKKKSSSHGFSFKNAGLNFLSGAANVLDTPRAFLFAAGNELGEGLADVVGAPAGQHNNFSLSDIARRTIHTKDRLYGEDILFGNQQKGIDTGLLSHPEDSPNLARKAAGFGLDLALDPLTYVAPGEKTLGGPKRVAQEVAVRGQARAAQIAEEASNAARNAFTGLGGKVSEETATEIGRRAAAKTLEDVKDVTQKAGRGKATAAELERYLGKGARGTALRVPRPVRFGASLVGKELPREVALTRESSALSKAYRGLATGIGDKLLGVEEAKKLATIGRGSAELKTALRSGKGEKAFKAALAIDAERTVRNVGHARGTNWFAEYKKFTKGLDSNAKNDLLYALAGDKEALARVSAVAPQAREWFDKIGAAVGVKKIEDYVPNILSEEARKVLNVKGSGDKGTAEFFEKARKLKPGVENTFLGKKFTAETNAEVRRKASEILQEYAKEHPDVAPELKEVATHLFSENLDEVAKVYATRAASRSAANEVATRLYKSGIGSAREKVSEFTPEIQQKFDELIANANTSTKEAQRLKEESALLTNAADEQMRTLVEARRQQITDELTQLGNPDPTAADLLHRAELKLETARTERNAAFQRSAARARSREAQAGRLDQKIIDLEASKGNVDAQVVQQLREEAHAQELEQVATNARDEVRQRANELGIRTTADDARDIRAEAQFGILNSRIYIGETEKAIRKTSDEIVAPVAAAAEQARARLNAVQSLQSQVDDDAKQLEKLAGELRRKSDLQMSYEGYASPNQQEEFKGLSNAEAEAQAFGQDLSAERGRVAGKYKRTRGAINADDAWRKGIFDRLGELASRAGGNAPKVWLPPGTRRLSPQELRDGLFFSPVGGGRAVRNEIDQAINEINDRFGTRLQLIEDEVRTSPTKVKRGYRITGIDSLAELPAAEASTEAVVGGGRGAIGRQIGFDAEGQPIYAPNKLGAHRPELGVSPNPPSAREAYAARPTREFNNLPSGVLDPSQILGPVQKGPKTVAEQTIDDVTTRLARAAGYIKPDGTLAGEFANMSPDELAAFSNKLIGKEGRNARQQLVNEAKRNIQRVVNNIRDDFTTSVWQMENAAAQAGDQAAAVRRSAMYQDAMRRAGDQGGDLLDQINYAVQAQSDARSARQALDEAVASRDAQRLAIDDALARARANRSRLGNDWYTKTTPELRAKEDAVTSAMGQWKRAQAIMEADDASRAATRSELQAERAQIEQALSDPNLKLGTAQREHVVNYLDHLQEAEQWADVGSAVSATANGIGNNQAVEGLQRVAALQQSAAEAAANVDSKLREASDFKLSAQALPKEEYLRDLHDAALREIKYGIGTPKEIADAITHADRITNAKHLKEMFKTYDKVVGLIKGYQIATPGFHVRNALGGIFNNSMDGVEYSSYVRMARLMRKAKFGKLNAEDRRLFDYVLESIGSGQVGSEFSPQSGPIGKALGALPEYLGHKPGESVERFLRGSMALDTLKREGGKLDELTRSTIMHRVSRFHFDYNDLSNVERNGIKRLIPFYTWTRKNLPLQIEMMVKQPRFINRYYLAKHSIEGLSDQDPIFPEWFNENQAIRLPLTRGGGHVYAMPDLPTRDLSRLGDVSNPIEGLRDDVLSQFTPIVKTPLELASNRKFFKGLPFKEYQVEAPSSLTFIPGVMQAMEKAGWATKHNGKWFVDDKAAYTAEQGIPLLGRIRRQLPSTESDSNKAFTSWLSFIGLGTRTNDKESQDQARYVQEVLPKKNAKARKRAQQYEYKRAGVG